MAKNNGIKVSLIILGIIGIIYGILRMLNLMNLQENNLTNWIVIIYSLVLLLISLMIKK
ncbi:MAG: hypothetical protein AABY22_30140 [Nanoarchaeota archaeon]